MLPLIRALACLPLLAAAKGRREEQQLVRWFRARDALDINRAATRQVDGAVSARVFDRLMRNEVIKASGERFSFEEPAYSAFRRRRRHRAALIVALLLLALAIMLLRGDVTL